MISYYWSQLTFNHRSKRRKNRLHVSHITVYLHGVYCNLSKLDSRKDEEHLLLWWLHLVVNEEKGTRGVRRFRDLWKNKNTVSWNRGVPVCRSHVVYIFSHLSYPERLQSLNLPTLEFRRQRNDVIETFKILNNFDKVDYQRQCGNCGNSLFKTSLGRTTRGHCKKLQVQHQTGPRRSFFAARVTQAWNRLSSDTVKADNIETLQVQTGEGMA